MTEPLRWLASGDAALAHAVREHFRAREALDLPPDVHRQVRSALLMTLSTTHGVVRPHRWSRLARWIGGVLLSGALLFALPPTRSPMAATLVDRHELRSPALRLVPLCVLASELTPPAARPTRRTAAPRAAREKPTEPVHGGDVADELALLRKARRALTRAPDQTLRLADEHAARYAAGMLAEERELLRLEAMSALGRSAELVRQVASFRHTFPDSAHLPRVDVLLEVHAH